MPGMGDSLSGRDGVPSSCDVVVGNTAPVDDLFAPASALPLGDKFDDLRSSRREPKFCLSFCENRVLEAPPVERSNC